jgi:hypothetical protein
MVDQGGTASWTIPWAALWSAVGYVVTVAVTAAVTLAVNRSLEKRARLLVYYGHAAAFTLRGGITFHLHNIVLWNAGRKSATNVRIDHVVLPEEYNLFPQVPYTEGRRPNGSGLIQIHRIVPGQELSIYYVYPPAIVYSQIHASITHDDGSVALS